MKKAQANDASKHSKPKKGTHRGFGTNPPNFHVSTSHSGTPTPTIENR
jgi:hypothetical protein